MTLFSFIVALAILPQSTLASPTEPIDLQAMALHSEAGEIQRAIALQKQGNFSAALKVLKPLKGETASLIRGRIFREEGKYDLAKQEFGIARQDRSLAPLLWREETLLATYQTRLADAQKHFTKMMASDYPKKSDVARTFAKFLQRHSLPAFDLHYETIKNITEDSGHQSFLLGLKAQTLRAQKNHRASGDLLKMQWVKYPRASTASRKEPKNVRLTNEDRLARAEVLLSAHQNEESLTTLRTIWTKTMTQEHWCNYSFIAGMAHRKLHNYKRAEKYLLKAMRFCKDENLRRRAHYVAAKVISIHDGLRAIKTIEDFAKTFAGHSMVDDVLFWAGDMYQRRARLSEAIAYYKRAENQPTAGDMCGESRWRRAWIAYRSQNYPSAAKTFDEILSGDGCVKNTEDLSRAQYWLGRSQEHQQKRSQATFHFQKAIELSPMGFYGQMAMTRLTRIAPSLYEKNYTPLTTKIQRVSLAICPGALHSDPQFQGAIELLKRGLPDDALSYILPLKKKSLQLPIPPAPCPQIEPGVLVALLLEKAGDKSQAQWFLRSHFKHYLKATPNQDQLAILRAAYPLAYREQLKAAEEKHRLPTFFLQALAREESAFNPEIVSWAGAYGLTQLLFSVAKSTAKRLKPAIKITSTHQLLEPQLNAHLGGALMGSLLKRYKGHKGLSLAAYNASVRVGNIWWKRHEKDEFDVFAEELTIRETRHYVKRVLTTYGIYRWLYGKQSPKLPVNAQLPPIRS